MPIPATSLIGGGVGLLQTAVGVLQKIKAAKLAKNNVRPVLTDNSYLNDAYNVATSNAGQGLSDSVKQAYITNNDRNLSSSLNAALTLGGDANLVSELYDNSGAALRTLAVADDAAMVRNRESYFSMAKAKASEQRDEFMINKYVPYRDTAELISKLSGEGMSNIWKGINTAGASAIDALDPYKTGKGIPGGQQELSGGSYATDDLSKFYTPLISKDKLQGKLATVPGLSGPGAFNPDTPWFASDSLGMEN